MYFCCVQMFCSFQTLRKYAKINTNFFNIIMLLHSYYIYAEMLICNDIYKFKLQSSNLIVSQSITFYMSRNSFVKKKSMEEKILWLFGILCANHVIIARRDCAILHHDSLLVHVYMQHFYTCFHSYKLPIYINYKKSSMRVNTQQGNASATCVCRLLLLHTFLLHIWDCGGSCAKVYGLKLIQ